MTSLGAVLEQYPDEVCVYVSDPRTGVQRGCKWPPTISEIVEACDRRVGDLARYQQYRDWGKREALPGLEAPRDNRLSLDELKAKYGPNWGMKSLDKPEVKFELPGKERLAELSKHYRQYGLAFQPKQQAAE